VLISWLQLCSVKEIRDKIKILLPKRKVQSLLNLVENDNYAAPKFSNNSWLL
jgi:hypothetical protein